MKTFQNSERNPQYTKEIKQLNKKYGENKVVFFNMEYPIETMFYTDYIAYKSVPDTQIIHNIIEKGYKVVVNDNGGLLSDTLMVKEIEIIHLTKYNQ